MEAPKLLTDFAAENNLEVVPDKLHLGSSWVLKCKVCNEELWFRVKEEEGGSFWFEDGEFRNGKLNLNHCEYSLVCDCDEERAAPDEFEVCW